MAKKLSTPFMTGMRTSMKVMSNSLLRWRSTASWPLEATCTLWPWSSSISARLSARSRSSSTIITLAGRIGVPRSLSAISGGGGFHGAGRLMPGLPQRQIDREGGSGIDAAVDIDRPAMLLDDLLHDRKAEAD